jgi:hypothetical protein
LNQTPQSILPGVIKILPHNHLNQLYTSTFHSLAPNLHLLQG